MVAVRALATLVAGAAAAGALPPTSTVATPLLPARDLSFASLDVPALRAQPVP
jgi:hypothetical protein